MVLEEHPIQIPHFSLVPIRTMEHRHRTWHRIRLIRIRLHPDPPSKPDTQQMIHHLEPLLTFGEVNTADVHDSFKLALTMVTEESKDGYDSGGRDVKREFVFEDGELLDEFGETLGEVRPVVVQFLCCLGVFGQRRVGRSWFGEWRC